jgi:hypothetical protein
MAVSITAAKPAAGPLTLVWDSLNKPTITPPITPAITPESIGAPLASATPKHNGKATKNTTTLDGKSNLILANIYKFSFVDLKLKNA